jgi:hypothetical protein
MAKKKKNPHRGTSLDSFLAEEGILKETQTFAIKEFLARLRALPVRHLKVSPTAIIRQERDRLSGDDRR